MLRDEGDGGRAWVLEHPARATRWVRAAAILILPKEEDAQIYSMLGGMRETANYGNSQRDKA